MHQLKRDLLLPLLEQTPDVGVCKRLCGAANQAADLAWGSRQPLQVFPFLFEDLARLILEQNP